MRKDRRAYLRRKILCKYIFNDTIDYEVVTYCETKHVDQITLNQAYHMVVQLNTVETFHLYARNKVSEKIFLFHYFLPLKRLCFVSVVFICKLPSPKNFKMYMI